MTRKLTGRARSLAMVGGASLLLALALGVPELAAIGAGAVVVLLVGLHLGGESQVDLSVVAGGQRVVEGDAVALTIRVVTARRTTSVVLWVTTGGADPVEIGTPVSSVPARVVPTDGGFTAEFPALHGPAHIDVEVKYMRWGIHPLPEVGLTVTDPFGLFEQRLDAAPGAWEGAASSPPKNGSGASSCPTGWAPGLATCCPPNAATDSSSPN